MTNQVAGRSVSDSQSVKPHFQDYIIRVEETKQQLDNKIHELQLINEQQQRKIEVTRRAVTITAVGNAVDHRSGVMLFSVCCTGVELFSLYVIQE